MDWNWLPHLNAALNSLTAILLLTGYRAIRRGDPQRHRAAMIGAFTVAVLFLVSYITYHVGAGTTRYPGDGWDRRFYLAILLSHTVLAASVPVLATLTLVLGLRGRHPRHRRVARWTLPIWLYVSATGVLVYGLLYWGPGSG